MSRRSKCARLGVNDIICAPSRRAASEDKPLPQPTSRNCFPASEVTCRKSRRERYADSIPDSSISSRNDDQFRPKGNRSVLVPGIVLALCSGISFEPPADAVLGRFAWRATRVDDWPMGTPWVSDGDGCQDNFSLRAAAAQQVSAPLTDSRPSRQAAHTHRSVTACELWRKGTTPTGAQAVERLPMVRTDQLWVGTSNPESGRRISRGPQNLLAKP